MSDLFIPRDEARKDMLTAAAFLAERIRSADGHAEAMNAVIPLYLGQNNVDLAAELSNAIGDPYARDRLLTLVAQKCADVDDDEYALQLADAIEDDALRSQALERIGLIKARKGETEAALSVADTMVHPDFVFAEVAINAESAGDLESCDQYLSQIDYPTAGVHAMEQIASTAITKGNLDDAVTWLDRAVESAGGIEHDEERIRSLIDLGNLFIQAKRNDKAIETFELARQNAERLDNMHRDHFLVGCALGFLHAGSDDMMDRTLDLVTDKTQMASALIGSALEYWRKEAPQDALDTLDEAHSILKSQRDNEIRDPRGRTALLTSVATHFATFEQRDRAVEIALDIPDPEAQSAALMQIAQVMAGRGEDDEAGRTAKMIDDDSSRLIALLSISDVKDRTGHRETGIAFLNEAAELAETVPQLGVRSEILNAIADRFALRGDPERARQIAHESLGVIAEIRDESSQAASLAELSRVYRDAGLELNNAELKILDKLTQK